MPSLNFKDYQEKTKQGTGFDRTDLEELLNSTLEVIDILQYADAPAEIIRELSTYHIYANSIAVNGPLPDDSEARAQEALDNLDDLKDFFGAKSEDGKTNLQKIEETVKKKDPEAFVKFQTSLKKLSDAAGLEIDFSGIGLENAPQEEKEEPEDVRQEGPDDELVHGGMPIRGDVVVEPPTSAALYIENLRDHAFPKRTDLTEQEKANCCDGFAKILAARDMVQSDIGDKSKLQKNLVGSALVEAHAETLKKDPSFKAFLDMLKDDPKKMQAAIAAATKRPGHGGGLDLMFKDYLKNLPPNELRNVKVLDRWMPTVKERIEALKKHGQIQLDLLKQRAALNAKLQKIGQKSSYANKSNALQAQIDELDRSFKGIRFEASEILVLRNMIRAERGDKASLDKKIPTEEKDTLKSTCYKIVDDAEFDDALQADGVADALARGHGGELIEKIRENCDLDNVGKAMKEELYKTTMVKRLSEMGDKAGQIADALEKHPNDLKTFAEAKELIAEYILLDGNLRDKKTNQVDEFKELTRDVPYGQIEKMKATGPDHLPGVGKMIQNLTPAGTAQMLKRMSEEPYPECMQTMGSHLKVAGSKIDAIRPLDDMEISMDDIEIDGKGLENALPGILNK